MNHSARLRLDGQLSSQNTAKVFSIVDEFVNERTERGTPYTSEPNVCCGLIGIVATDGVCWELMPLSIIVCDILVQDTTNVVKILQDT